MDRDKELNFNLIYHDYYQNIYRYVAKLAGNNDAEDLTQEVFIKVDHALESFRGESQISTWVYRIATNVVMDNMRSMRSKNDQKNISLYDDVDIESDNIIAKKSIVEVDRQLIQVDMNKCIRGIVDTLPDDYKLVLVLSQFEELKNREIADILQISLDTVKVRLHRARKQLQKKLGRNCCIYHDERNELVCDPRN
ncbi:MAG: sigma-70 family RNA polymerase sigma factor [Sedimenticola sp.]